MASATIHGKAEELPTPPSIMPLRGITQSEALIRVRAGPLEILVRSLRQRRAKRRQQRRARHKRKYYASPLGSILPERSWRPKSHRSNDGHVEAGFALQVRHQLRPSHPLECFLRYASRISTHRQARHAFSRPGVRISARHFSLPQQSGQDN